jgi:acetyltransferase-like isoleucine patch superfamily enzyme
MADVHEKRECDDEPIWIEDDVWIGTRAIVLKGVRLGRGSVVAAGAVVTHDVPAYSVVAGVPARVVSERFDAETLAQHEAILRSGASETRTEAR